MIFQNFCMTSIESNRNHTKMKKQILKNHRKIIHIIEKSQKNPRKAASQFLNPVSIDLKKLPQMPASRFLKYTGRNWPNPVCSFYLPVSTSRDATVYVYIYVFIYIYIYLHIDICACVCVNIYIFIYIYIYIHIYIFIYIHIYI